MDTKHRKLKVWAEIIPEFIYDCNQPFFETLVPTIDTVRYGYLFEKLLSAGKPVMFTGNTGNNIKKKNIIISINKSSTTFIPTSIIKLVIVI